MNYNNKWYLINKNTQEVHLRICKEMKKISYINLDNLGEHVDSHSAVSYAIGIAGYKNADGCKYCCPESHTK